MAKKLVTKRRRLFFDCETSHNIGVFFRAGFKQFIDYASIIRERAIICICYKWEGEKDIYSLQWDNKQCDKKMLEKFVEVMNTADEIVGHNVDRYDLAWVRTRCLVHRIEGVLPKYTTIDTLKVARSTFALQSNKLDYLAILLGVGRKIKTDHTLWTNILLNKDKAAMDKMIKYCKGDVKILENVFNELNKHMPNKTHYGVVFNQDRGSCPECGSDELEIIRRRTTATGLRKIQFKCKTCFKYNTKTDK